MLATFGASIAGLSIADGRLSIVSGRGHAGSQWPDYFSSEWPVQVELACDTVDRVSTSRRVVGVLAGAFAFGVLASLAKGPGGADVIPEARTALGNLSTPWLLTAFVAGTRFTRTPTAALAGLIATMTALVGFYVVTSIFHDASGDGFFADLRVELSANRGYIQGGLITGPVFGALGWWWQQKNRTLPASFVAGACLMAEPLVLMVLGAFGPAGVLPAGSGLPDVVRIIPGWHLSANSRAIPVAVYTAEFILGIVVVLWATRRLTRQLRESA
jgi:hypothetical protein